MSKLSGLVPRQLTSLVITDLMIQVTTVYLVTHSQFHKVTDQPHQVKLTDLTDQPHYSFCS